ncbi:unnamed protein product [Rotaria sordida]|uniref:Uncharacterized protein n=1 Tax=Rotaria sordida TaxID=392033 RepID=A0A814PXM9_9BILA|nr:unnamed protein product [Rotaria sordida]
MIPFLDWLNVSNSVWISAQVPSIDSHKQYGTEQPSELLIKIKNVLDITHRTKSKIDNQVIRMEIVAKTSSINKQALIVLTDIIQQLIITLAEKKSKQHLQTLSHQIDQFKTDIIKKLNAIPSTAEQQTIATSSTSQVNQTLKSKTPISNDKNARIEDQSMEVTDDT